MPKETRNANTVYEKNYYREFKNRICKINRAAEKREIERFLETYHDLPKGTACEKGFSSVMFEGSDLEVNPSMLCMKKAKNNTAFILSRLKKSKAPKLPVSCIASAEHVIALQNKVEDFQSEMLPKSSKARVMYQILVKVDSLSTTKKISLEKQKLIKVICKDDDLLTKKNVTVNFDTTKALFIVELGTQIADIQHVLRNLNSVSDYHVVSCEFEDIGLNEGVCLLKADASNPIHAVVNIAQGHDNDERTKFFLERDAGLTSGKNLSSYQDNKWTFNFFTSLKGMRCGTGYPEDAHAIKICKK